MDMLARINQDRLDEVKTYRDRHQASHRATRLPGLQAYAFPALKARMTDALSRRWGKGVLTPQFDLIDRSKFGGDIALKFPELLKDGGPKAFMADHVGWIVEVLEGVEFEDAVARVETRGMYVNVTLADRWLLSAAADVASFGSVFGQSDALTDHVAVVDYSSPNVAKRLHAGHIRSTIIGHVLANLYDAAGALTYRVNHINDFGGFGFMLEGYRRFEQGFPDGLSDNEKLLEIYRIRRVLETAASGGDAFAALTPDDRALLERYVGTVSEPAEAERYFRAFDAAATRRFADLEAGKEDEVRLWQRMVRWSLEDFEGFYDSLDIHIPLVLGESFYFHLADRVIADALQSGKAVRFGRDHADKAIADIEAQFAEGAFAEPERDKRIEAVEKDIGAVVVPLEGGDRYVVQRADGRSIYATRDLGAIKMRSEVLGTTDFLYVVGQEQRVHFSRLFSAARSLDLVPETAHLKHLYFGFYVDAESGKKLSSRESVANVTDLLKASHAHFKARFGDRDMSQDELESAAKQLSIGSLVFNDLKQDVKGSVEIDSQSLEKTIEGFEKSGGAYVVYAACRARSILRKHGQGPKPVNEIEDVVLDGQEAELVLKIAQLPEVVVKAAATANPTLLVRHLYDIAAVYNSYYMRAPVLVDGVANDARLLLTDALTGALTSGLRISHIECPDRI